MKHCIDRWGSGTVEYKGQRGKQTPRTLEILNHDRRIKTKEKEKSSFN